MREFVYSVVNSVSKYFVEKYFPRKKVKRKWMYKSRVYSLYILHKGKKLPLSLEAKKATPQDCEKDLGERKGKKINR